MLNLLQHVREYRPPDDPPPLAGAGLPRPRRSQAAEPGTNGCDPRRRLAGINDIFASSEALAIQRHGSSPVKCFWPIESIAGLTALTQEFTPGLMPVCVVRKVAIQLLRVGGAKKSSKI
jgi:hypothetical protein